LVAKPLGARAGVGSREARGAIAIATDATFDRSAGAALKSSFSYIGNCSRVILPLKVAYL
jgi:hypothetical protein